MNTNSGINQEISFGLSDQYDIDALKKLWYYCFPEDRGGEYLGWYFNQYFQMTTTYVAKYDNQVIAMVFAPSHKMQIRGRCFDVPYLQGVAVSPSWRGQGIAKQLLDYSVADLQKQEKALAVLEPFAPGFYEAMDWSYFGYLLKYKLPTAELTTAKPSRRLTYVYAEKPWEYAETTQKIYEAWLNTNLAVANYVVRSPEAWHNLLLDHQGDGGHLLLAYEYETPVGYMLYTIQGDLFFIRELAYTTQTALNSLLALAKEHSKAKRTLLIAPRAAGSHLLLPETLAGTELYPFVMARLFDIPRLFTGLAAPKSLKEPIYLQPLDGGIAKNNELIKIYELDGKTVAEPTKAKSGVPAERILTIPTKLLTKAYLGCYNCRDYSCQNLLEASQELIKIFDELLPKQQSYFYELF